MFRAAYGILFGLFLASPLAWASSQYNLTEGVSPTSHAIYDLHMTIFWICVVIGIVVFGTIFYAILHHRKSQGAVAAQFHEHLWLEVTWTIIPTLILIAMAIPATKVLISMNDFNQSDLTIKITGYQWKWHYDYLDQDIHFFSNLATPFDQLQGKAKLGEHYLREVNNVLVVPVHKKIRFLVTANDVIHSWWVPDLGVKRDAVPGYITEAWTRINKPGTYYGQCAELCGVNHGFMPIVVVAVSDKEFAEWIAKKKGIATPQTPSAPASPTSTPATPVVAPAPVAKTLSQGELMKQGEQVYMTTCAICHKPDGSGMPPTFPALKGSKIATGPLSEHLKTVINGKPGTAMQAFKDQLSAEDIAAVVTYERNAFGNNKGELVQPGEVAAVIKTP